MIWMFTEKLVWRGMSVLEYVEVKELTDRLDHSIFMENIGNCKAYQEIPCY